jgi:hypothetical protein
MRDRCSFCDQDASTTRCLIVAPNGDAICGDCVVRCCELLHDDHPELIARLLDRLLHWCAADVATERRCGGGPAKEWRREF